MERKPSLPPAAEEPVLRLEGIAKRFGNVIALDRVDLEFRAGTVTALTGENGSGKSTIAKILGGVLAPDAGRILVDGRPVILSNSRVALTHGIALISQELTLATDLSVAENVFLGRLPTRRGVVSWGLLYRRTKRLLEHHHIDLDPRVRVGDLPIEKRQQVEILRALAVDPRVLILDEATSSLSEQAADRLLQLVEERRSAGAAVVMITHRMNEIYGAASSAAVLRDGHIIDRLTIPDTPSGQLVRLMVGRELGDYYGQRSRPPDDQVVLEAVGVRAPGQGLARTDLRLRRGEVLGIAGLSGSGKEILGQALTGATEAAGELSVDGHAVRLGDPTAALANGIGFVPEDRRRMALLLDRSVRENFALAWVRILYRAGLRRISVERRMVEESVERYGVRATSADLPVRLLSGGNQQKVVIGRLFELALPVYVMSEPTRGIDVGSKSAVYRLLREQSAQGAGIVFISSELNELCGMCDRVLVMYAGRVVDELVGAEATEEAITHAMVTGRPIAHVSAVGGPGGRRSA